MRPMKPRLRFFALTLLALLTAWSCGGGEGNTVAGNGGHGASSGTSGAGGSGAGSSGTGGSGADGGIDLDGSQGDITALTVEPPSALIAVTNGASAPVDFKAIATFAGGGTGTVAASWSFDDAAIAAVSASGQVKAQNAKGGKGTLTASAGGKTATASVEVRLAFTDNGAGLTPAEQDAFNSPDAAPSGTLLYPYDRTVFARGILPPELQWSGGAAGDRYKLSITSSYVSLTGYETADPPSRMPIPKAWWTALTESNDGSPVTVSIARLDAGGVAHQPMTETWTIAPGSLRGTIYYWAVNRGSIVKINPGADAPVPAFDPGPYTALGSPPPSAGYGGQSPPWDNNGTGDRCVACHTVSKDGSTLVTLFSACGTSGGGTCGRPWGAVDTATETITSMSEYVPGDAIFSALSPDGKRLVHDTVGFRMKLADPVTTQLIPSALDALSQVASPQFSPDGKLLAFAGNCVGSYPIEFWSSDLQVMDVDLGAAPYFSNLRQVVAGGGQAISFPSFTPDSQWIVYQRGDYSRANYVSGGGTVDANDDLFMADVAAAAGEIRLGLANGDGMVSAADLKRNYDPRVNPIAVGGYFWVVFVTPRDYGNRMPDAAAGVFRHKQLWVAAIDANPKPGVDPSHPAFWLPGQDLTSINMDAYWALEPCKQQGGSCSEGYECCSGFCRDQGGGSFACVPPPTNQCATIGEACKTASDCCASSSPVACIGGFCALRGPA